MVEVVTTMLNLCDAVHHIHNTIGDINKLPDFKFVSSNLASNGGSSNSV